MLKRLGVRHIVEGVFPFTANLDYGMGIVIRAHEIRDASIHAWCTKGLLVDAMYAGPEAATHSQHGSETIDGNSYFRGAQ